MANPCPTPTIQGCQFTQLLVDQQPVYDKMILEDIRPEDGWILHVDTGEFPAYSGVQHTLDRFNTVFPNITKTWTPTQAGNCLGTPCDKTEHHITWGATRLTYFLEEQSWATPLLCYDQDMHVTHAKEHFRQIISDILKPATSAINSNFLRKRVAQFAGNQFVANSSFGQSASALTYTWVVVGNEEIYIDCNLKPTSKLTPQMLQRRVQPLMQVGYFGRQPFKDMPPLMELVTDLETCWELDRLGGQTGVGGTPSIAGNWRFEQWDAANKYWRYGFSGQIGNYAVRVDPFNIRFNYIGIVGGKQRFQVVLPYKNIASSGAGGAAGLRDIVNPDYQNAQFAWSYNYHRKGMQCLVADATPVNPEMPFSSRNFGGRWQFVMDNLGADSNGVPIENKRRNKGQFIADFKMAIRPMYTELVDLYFHMREPSCIIVIAPCNPDPGYPAQSYSSADTPCANTAAPYTLSFTAVLSTDTNTYEIEANTIQCMGVPTPHGRITGAANTTDLVTQLNLLASEFGTWSRLSASTIQLVGTCSDVNIPWVP